MGISIYEVDLRYVDYICQYAPHMFQNSTAAQKHKRKYIGIVLTVNNMNYFAPLSSFKAKHMKMKEGLSLIKIGRYAVINLNNMFPVPDGLYSYCDFNKEKDSNYRAILRAEYRIIKKKQDRIVKNARNLYSHRIKNGEQTSLGRICNDFILLENKCKEYTE